MKNLWFFLDLELLLGKYAHVKIKTVKQPKLSYTIEILMPRPNSKKDVFWVLTNKE